MKSGYWHEGYNAAINLMPNDNQYLELSRPGQEWRKGYDQAMEDKWQEGYDAAINLQPNNNKYLESSCLGQEWQEGYDQAMEDMWHGA